MKEKEMTEDLKISKYVFNKKFGSYGFIKDDLIQESLIALWKARKNFDETKSKYSTFAVNVSINAMKMFLRKELKHSNVDCIEEVQFTIEDPTFDVSNYIHVKGVVENTISNIKKNKDFVKAIVQKFCDGFSGNEIAKQMKCSRQTIYDNFNKFKKQFAENIVEI